jgi:hypothetical protein
MSRFKFWQWFRKPTRAEVLKKDLEEVEQHLYSTRIELLKKQASLQHLVDHKTLLLQMQAEEMPHSHNTQP